MSYFIIEQLFLLSIATIVFLFVRNLPQVRNFGDNAKIIKENKNSITSNGHNLADKFDDKLSRLIEKALRKLKVIIMRIDNYISSRLKSFSSKDNEGLENQNSIFNNFDKNGTKVQNKKIVEEVVSEKDKIIVNSDDNDE